MRWKISPYFQTGHHHTWSRRPHDSRTLDVLAIIALLALVIGSGWYLSASLATAPSTMAFVEPSQSVHW